MNVRHSDLVSFLSGMTNKPQRIPWMQHFGGTYLRLSIVVTRRFGSGIVQSLAADRSGRRVVTAGGWWVTFWDTSVLDATTYASRCGLLGALNLYPQSVNAVSWDPDGRRLAVGGGTGTVSLLRHVDGPGQAVFDEAPLDLIENWQEVSRLLGHKSDIVDIAWGSSAMLASASLDNSVIVWNAFTQECLLKLEGHRSFVKAVAWDPQCVFLASLSDDRGLIIWRIPEGIQETKMVKPFEMSPVSSCSTMRMDWSPDGGKLIAVHATKSNHVQLCAVITRGKWSYEYRGIEGRGSITLAKFNPCLFSKDGKFCHYWVSAGTAGIVNLWKESLESDTETTDADKEPVLTTVLDGPITDLCWRPDGYTLLLCLADGTVEQWRLNESTLGTRLTTVEVSAPESHTVMLERKPKQEIVPRVVRPPGKRIVPLKVEEDEMEVPFMTPTKRRRMRSLCHLPEMASVQKSFPVTIRSRRAHQCSLNVDHRRRHRSADPSTACVIYQELGMHIWSMMLDICVAHAIANDTFLCIVSSEWHLMVL